MVLPTGQHWSLALLVLAGLLSHSLSLQLIPTKWRQKFSSDVKKEDSIRLAKSPKLPNVRYSRLSGVLPDFRQDAAASLIKHSQYCWDHNLPGIKFSLGVAGSLQLVLDPAVVEAVMTDRRTPEGPHGIMFKSNLDRRGVGLLTGTGVLLSDGQDHTRKRRLILPSFDAKSLANFVSTMEEVSLEFAHATTSTKPTNVNIPELTSAIAMKIVGLCLFSADVVGNQEIHQDITKCLEHVVYVTRHPLAAPQWIPTRRNRQFKKSISTLDNLIDDLIQSGRKRAAATNGQTTKDLLCMLLSARYESEDGESSNSDASLSNKELRDEVMTLFLAGHETTAIALSWTLWFLSDPKHHHWQEKVVEEYDDIMQTKGGFTPQVLQDAEAMKYTRAALCEALRLRTPSYAVDRQVQCDTILTPKEGPPIRVKKGELLLISPLAMHLNPHYFEHPNEYNPSRFLSQEALSSSDPWDGPYDRSYYLPFGAGRKRCIGYRFAQWEMLIILSVLMKHAKVTRMSESQEVQWTPEVTLRPDRSLELQFERREASSIVAEERDVGVEGLQKD